MARIEKSKVFVIFYAACLIPIMMIGCQSWTDEIGSHMDQMAKGYEKFGTISISTPILVEAKKDANDGYFDFDLKTNPNDYYDTARTEVQGRSAIFDQFVQASGLGIKVQADITALMGYMASLQEYAQKSTDYQRQRAHLAQIAELKARKVITELPENATDAQRIDAIIKAEEIRAGVLMEEPSVPTAPKIELPSADESIAPDGDQAEGGLTSGGFTQALGLLADSSALKISNRSAINTAAGDTITEGIFRLLGNPAKAMVFKDKLMMFGVSMVSVSPGWLTRKNYTGELSVSCDYCYDIARIDLLTRLLENEKNKDAPDKDDKLIDLINAVLNETRINKSEIIEEYESGETLYETKDDYIPQRFNKDFREQFSPSTAAVSPMTDVDALDLSSSRRRQISNALNIATALSYAGLKAQSEFFQEWAKRSEQDVRTRTAYAAVTAFSSGGFFGFRVRPRLKALENPALFGSKSENVLEHQTFPIAVIIGFDKDDLKLGFDVERDDYGDPVIDESGKVKLVAFEPYFMLRQTTSWLPDKFMLNSKNRLSETERLRWASSYIKAYEGLSALENSIIKDIKYYEIDKFIENRISLLGVQTLENWSIQCLPIDWMIEE